MKTILTENETMNENENNLFTDEEKKEKIRKRYKGIDQEELDVIPAKVQDNFYDKNKKKRVAVYARVSTGDPRQTTSYELQKNHYIDMVNSRPDWELVDIYADEGISGTSLKHRDSFVRMIEDCENGKIDVIVTKSVSRFARNLIDCVGYVRRLQAMNPPVGIFFETENLYTLNASSEMPLSFIATMAQEESHVKSDIMNYSIEHRFERGIFLTPPLLGYDNDSEGNLIINAEEANIVLYIYFSYIYGNSCEEIAKKLTEMKCKTKKGNTRWSSGSIYEILGNERYCGDVLARKTFTPSYLDHKSKKNNRDRNQYRQRDHHEAIISRDDFIAVQHKLRNMKYGSQSFLPALSSIKDGLLKGFVLVNTKWAGFNVEDYISASKESTNKTDNKKIIDYASNNGDFDFHGFEITRVQFINTIQNVSVRLSENYFMFNMEAIRKYPENQFVQLYIDPAEKLLAVKPCKKEDKYCVQWSRRVDEKIVGRQIFSAAFLPTLFNMMGWVKEYKYKCIGYQKDVKKQSVLIFNLTDYEALVPKDSIDDPLSETHPLVSSGNNNIVAYPPEWSDSFGTSVYEHPYLKESILLSDKEAEISDNAITYKNHDLNITEPEEIQKRIEDLTAYFGGKQNDQKAGE